MEMIVKDQLYRKVREHNKKGDWELHKAVKSSCNNIVKSAKKCYNGNLLSKHKNNPRTFWKIIKSNFPESKAKAVQLSVTFSSENDQNNDLNMANSFCEHFSNIGTCLKEKSLPLCNFVWKQTPSIPRKTDQIFIFKYVSETFVENSTNQIKSEY